jgi:transcriptional regulator with XRE-family HTH domain
MKINPKDFVPAQAHVPVTTGEVIRILRDKKGWTQEELARRCGISATNLSSLENDQIDIGKRRAEALAKAFGVHPAIIMFPEYESKEIAKAA